MTNEQLKVAVEEIKKKVELNNNLISLGLLAAGGSLPITSVGQVFSGDLIGVQDRYLDLYKNNYPRLIAIKVTAEFAIPGAVVSLSLSTSPSNIDRIDVLSSVGKVISDTIWLRPNQNIYINTADTTFTCAGSTFRVLLFDPLSFLNIQ